MKKLLLIAVLFTAFATSCKKESCPVPVTPTYPIEGSWYGKYGNGTGAQTNGFSMLIELGGTLVVADGASISGTAVSSRGTGTWTLSGTTFKATYSYPGGGSALNVIANFSNTGKLEAGTWGTNAAATSGGTWFLDRKN
jgi:hypothetical protein